MRNLSVKLGQVKCDVNSFSNFTFITVPNVRFKNFEVLLKKFVFHFIAWTMQMFTGKIARKCLLSSGKLSVM